MSETIPPFLIKATRTRDNRKINVISLFQAANKFTAGSKDGAKVLESFPLINFEKRISKFESHF